MDREHVVKSEVKENRKIRPENVALVTVTHNDGFKLKQWRENFDQYSDQFGMHIIVDNGSQASYIGLLEQTFPECKIICRKVNGGLTAAYNDGIKFATTDNKIDAIMLLANDVLLSKDCVSNLLRFINEDEEIGSISPVIFTGRSNIIEDYGSEISSYLAMVPFGEGEELNDRHPKIRYCAANLGGVNISTRKFYDKVGLQDENLFMYSDEVDMGLRAKKNGYKIAVTKAAMAWHLHIDPPSAGNFRAGYTKYLIGRNKVYLARKHFSPFTAFYVFLIYFLGAIVKVLAATITMQPGIAKIYLYMIAGSFMGLIGNMKPNKLSSLQ